MKVQLLGRGFAWLDTGTHDSLSEASTFVEVIEKRQGLKVACLEEIAFKQGWIDEKRLEQVALPMIKNQYGQYLMRLIISRSSSEYEISMEKDSKIFVAGHRGLVGSAILNNLRGKGYTNFLLRTHAELDLTDQAAVNEFFAAERPDYVFLSAAHVGGIMANSLYRADFIYNNLMIQNNVIHASWKNNVKKLFILGKHLHLSREAPQPMPRIAC